MSTTILSSGTSTVVITSCSSRKDHHDRERPRVPARVRGNRVAAGEWPTGDAQLLTSYVGRERAALGDDDLFDLHAFQWDGRRVDVEMLLVPDGRGLGGWVHRRKVLRLVAGPRRRDRNSRAAKGRRTGRTRISLYTGLSTQSMHAGLAQRRDQHAGGDADVRRAAAAGGAAAECAWRCATGPPRAWPAR